MAAPLADDFSSIQTRLLQIQTDEGRKPAAPKPAANPGLPKQVFGEEQGD
jgi:hypothetical protein